MMNGKKKKILNAKKYEINSLNLVVVEGLWFGGEWDLLII